VVVLRENEVQRPPHEPADDQRAVGEQPVDVGCGQALRARPNRQARSPEVLSLDGQQAPYDVERARGWLAQKLGSHPPGAKLPPLHGLPLALAAPDDL
jgi:hypothetical protein